jgi:hypothetical protein
MLVFVDESGTAQRGRKSFIDKKTTFDPFAGLVPIIAGRSIAWLAAPASLAKERVEVVVGTDPDPDNRIAIALADRAVLLIDPHRPDLFVAGQLLET